METQQNSSILEKIISEQAVSHLLDFNPAETLQRLLEILSERERQVLIRRFGLMGGEPETLEKIGQSFQVTRERIRQIERQAIQKLKDSQTAQQVIKLLKDVVVEILEKEGGVVSLKRFQRIMAEYGKGLNGLAIEFLLNEILSDLVVLLEGVGLDYETAWRLRSAAAENLQLLVDKAEDVVTARAKPVADADLARELILANLTDPLGRPLTDSALVLSLLEISRRVRRNPFGDWGLAHWETITPRRMNDKIYLVLKRAGKPLHFREIVRLINEQKFDSKVAYAPTVHNELILDKKYVLVGRGIYALREWGYQPGVVADVLQDILRLNGPLSLEALVAEVLKRRFVKKGTIQLALANRQLFQKLADGRYVAVSDTASTPVQN